ncbi:MAG: hypothetical protein V2A34_03675, partial [Lentisphaerota bacterium]
YDLVVVEQPIQRAEDLPVRPIHWQKLFIPRHPGAARYESIVFLDADIIINYHRAPCVVSSVPPDRIGMTRFDRYIDDPVLYDLVFIRRYKFARYAQRAREQANGAPPSCITGPDYSKTYAEFTGRRDLPLINTGMMVINPRLHGPLLESIYDDSFRELKSGAQEKIFEQNYVSYKLLEAGVIHFVDPRFNTIAYLEQALHYPFLDLQADDALMRLCYSTMLANCFFLHFAANWHLMSHAVINGDKDFSMVGLKDVFRNDRERIRCRAAKQEACAV